MPKLTEWRKGPPPCVGWWNASTNRYKRYRRWWNGERWSRAVFVGQSDEVALYQKSRLVCDTEAVAIEWRGLAEPPEGMA